MRSLRIVRSLVLSVALLALAAFGWYAYLVHEMRQLVRAELNDPESAQFRNERFFGPWSASGASFCGQVNAKNAMGGYVGFTAFEVMNGKAFLESTGTRKFLDDYKLGHCTIEAIDQNLIPWWWLRW